MLYKYIYIFLAYITLSAPDEEDPLFGGPLMIAGADYLPPYEGGTDQILDMPLTQSARKVCYTQQTYEDEDIESDETFTIKIIQDRRQENMLDNLVIDEGLGSVQVTIIDDDGELCGIYSIHRATDIHVHLPHFYNSLLL